MFGVIAAGRLVQTNFEQINETRFLTTVEEADKVNHLVIFLTGSTPFPDGFGGAVYLSWANEQGQLWQLLGHLSNMKPSAIFKVSNLNATAGGQNPFGQQTSFMTVSVPAHNTAQIGISVEPLEQLQSQTPASNTQVSTVNTFVQFSSKMLENLFNFVSSFALTQAQMVPNPNETYVPLSSVQTWFANFKRKLEQDPYFWKS